VLVFLYRNTTRLIEHIYCTGLRLAYNSNLWDDLTVYTLTKEFTLNDYLYKYWYKFNKHLDNSAEAHQYQLSFNAYLTAKTPQKNWYLSMGMRKNSKFLNRLSIQAKHSKIDLIEFLNNHHQQYGYFKHASSPLHFFIYEYLLITP
jgi:hypothetical protein